MPYFKFKEKKYRYFYHPYNHTWGNERAIEIPILLGEIKKYANNEILEVGNVLNHYYPEIEHEIIDKYEKSPKVINGDVVDFELNKKYQLIFSISTIEHVGLDEKVKDSEKIPKSIANLKKHLKKGGEIIITAPIGYNSVLDKIIEERKFFNEVYFLKKRIFNKWGETAWENVKNSTFKEDAKSLAIIIIK